MSNGRIVQLKLIGHHNRPGQKKHSCDILKMGFIKRTIKLVLNISSFIVLVLATLSDLISKDHKLPHGMDPLPEHPVGPRNFPLGQTLQR